MTHPLLRSRLHPLRLTSLESTPDCPPGHLVLCPRLCWAAEIAELEQVQVLNLHNGARLSLTVRFGLPGEVRLPGGKAFGFAPLATVQVSTTEIVPMDQVPTYRATFVLVDARSNAPLEITRQTARPAPKEPSFTALPPRVVTTEPVSVA